MTPLFAATLSSQTGQTQTDYGGTVGSSLGAAGGIRATQRSVEFTPTQGKANLNAPGSEQRELISSCNLQGIEGQTDEHTATKYLLCLCIYLNVEISQ